jgi:hypothetical protein
MGFSTVGGGEIHILSLLMNLHLSVYRKAKNALYILCTMTWNSRGKLVIW